MTKPVSSAMLAACVERWTGRKTTAPSQWWVRMAAAPRPTHNGPP